MSANNRQVSGKHYSDKAIQPWDYITGNGMGYLEGNVVKYVSRFREKNGIEDLRKAMHYLEKLIELECEEVTDADYPLVRCMMATGGPCDCVGECAGPRVCT